MRCEIEAGPDGIVTVRHDLGTTDVAVSCEWPDGSPAGFWAAVPINEDEVEVVVVPGTAAVVVERETPAQ